jgi:hypothetical protein
VIADDHDDRPGEQFTGYESLEEPPDQGVE